MTTALEQRSEGNAGLAAAAGQASIQFQDEGSNLGTSGTATTVNFTGAGVTASRATNTVTVNVPVSGEAFPVGSIFFAAVSTNPATLLGYGTWSAIGAGRVLVGIDAGDADFDTLGETGGSKTSSHTHPAGTLTTDTFAAHTHGYGTIATVAESSHTHGYGTIATVAESSHTHGGGTLVTNTQGAHQHTYGTLATGAESSHTHGYGTIAVNDHTDHSHGSATGDIKAGAVPYYDAVGKANPITHTVSGSTGTGTSHNHSISGLVGLEGDHTHFSFTGSTAAGSSHSHGVSGSTAAGSSHSHGVSGSTASDGAHGHNVNAGSTGSTASSTVQPYLVVAMWQRTA